MLHITSLVAILVTLIILSSVFLPPMHAEIHKDCSMIVPKSDIYLYLNVINKLKFLHMLEACWYNVPMNTISS